MISKIVSFTTTVRINGFDFSLVKIFNKFLQPFKDDKNIIFVLNKVKPCIFCKIIYKNDIVTKVIIRAYRSKTPNFNEYDFKWFITRKKGNIKWKFVTFIIETCITMRDRTNLDIGRQAEEAGFLRTWEEGCTRWQCHESKVVVDVNADGEPWLCGPFVDVPSILASNQGCPCTQILHKKTIRKEFNGCTILRVELRNKNKITFYTRSTQNII